MSIIKSIFKVMKNGAWNEHYFKTSSDQVVHTKTDGQASTVKEQLDGLNSASIPGNLTEIKDPNKDTGLTVQYRIGFYSTEVFIFGNLKGSFTAWQPKDLGWIPRPNRPALAIIQYSIEPYYIQIQPDGMVQIVSRIDTTADGTYIGEHCMFLNATI